MASKPDNCLTRVQPWAFCRLKHLLGSPACKPVLDKDLPPQDKDLHTLDRDLQPADKDFAPSDKDLVPSDRDLPPPEQGLREECDMPSQLRCR